MSYDEAIDATSAEIELTGRTSPAYPGKLNTLTDLLVRRYDLGGARADLVAAIAAIYQRSWDDCDDVPGLPREVEHFVDPAVGSLPPDRCS